MANTNKQTKANNKSKQKHEQMQQTAKITETKKQ